ncbi:MAG: hypothetical protein H6863_01375 [Rhodospirillales bacterium]|nr:hypothetical protein [Rhodospirillales bacterium]
MRSIFPCLFLLCLFLVSAPMVKAGPIEASQKPVEKSYPILTPDPHILKKTGTATVVAVIDALRLQLDNDQIIQLSELDIPDLLQADPGDLALQGKELLESLFLNKKVVIYQSPTPQTGRTNRMGYALAHIIRTDDSVWAQGALLSAGLARVRTTPDNNALVSEMLTLEQNARDLSAVLEQEIGDTATLPRKTLWMDGKYQILTPQTAQTARREFQIVEGTVVSAATQKNVIYLNFGSNWRTDFTIGIKPEARRLFSKAGLQPLQWAGKTLRVRGWLEDYNGPYIDIDHPQRIEFIEPEQSAATPQQPPAKPAKKVIKNALPNPEKSGFNS